jgi:O-methyltransferase
MDQDNTSSYLDLLEKLLINDINPENGARMKFLVIEAVNGAEGKWNYSSLIAQLADLHRSHSDSIRALELLSNSDGEQDWWINTLGFPFSMIGRKRMHNVRECAETIIAERIPGAMVETGVWRGGACMMMKGVMKAFGDNRKLFVCDSFQGLPKLEEGPDSGLDLDQNPILSVPIEDVRSHFERLDLLDNDVYFIKGWFNETMGCVAEQAKDGVSLLRLDGDYYSSTMDVLNPLYPLVQPGGFVIIDDYYAYEQCRQATDEYRHANGITSPMFEIDGVGVYWRV